MKIFSHRGLVDKDHKENTIEAFKNAYNHGVRAIEFDIWFLENQLVLHHNKPVNLENIAKLKDLFTQFGSEIEYWCDFKNLTSKNCDDAISHFKQIVDELKIDHQKLYFAPFNSNFSKAKRIYTSINKYFGKSSKILALKKKLEPAEYQEFYQELKENNIFGLSIEHSNVTEEFKKIFSDIAIFAWTVNDQKIADDLKAIGIENIASDKILS